MAMDPITLRYLQRQMADFFEEFRGIFSQETVERFVQESKDRLAAARFGDFVPVLVYRFTRERLQALGQAEGMIAKDVPEVLFVCVHNAGRSQMAATLCPSVARDGFTFAPRGASHPTGSTPPWSTP